MKINKKNMESNEWKDTKEKNTINDFEIQNSNTYFQAIDLKNLESYENLIIEEINNNDTLSFKIHWINIFQNLNVIWK